MTECTCRPHSRQTRARTTLRRVAWSRRCVCLSRTVSGNACDLGCHGPCRRCCVEHTRVCNPCPTCVKDASLCSVVPETVCIPVSGEVCTQDENCQSSRGETCETKYVEKCETVEQQECYQVEKCEPTPSCHWKNDCPTDSPHSSSDSSSRDRSWPANHNSTVPGDTPPPCDGIYTCEDVQTCKIENVCEGTPVEVCKAVPEEHCETVPIQTCGISNICRIVEREECKTTEKTVCQPPVMCGGKWCASGERCSMKECCSKEKTPHCVR